MGNDRHARRGVRGWIWGGLAVALLAAWLVWWQWEPFRELFRGAPAPSGAVADKAETGPEESAVGLPTTVPTARDLAVQRWTEMLGEAPVWPADLSEPTSCEEVDEGLRRICGLLDARGYIRAEATPTGACGLVRQVAEELASRPPEISSELKSLPTLLANVFHLYRTLGARRTDLLRRIVFEEQELAEPAAMALYRWAVSRQHCAGPRETPLTLESLYAHAGFLFQTLGGQAYLHRRSPRVEGLVGFYALLVIDHAQSADYNPAGIDPRHEIQRVRALLEREPLVFREDYLRTLDGMADRWKQRSEPDL